MYLILGLLLVGIVAFQWFTQEATLRIWGPWRISFHRDEWPAFFWSVLGLESGLGLLFVYLFFAK
jgi:hypothetical protein